MHPIRLLSHTVNPVDCLFVLPFTSCLVTFVVSYQLPSTQQSREYSTLHYLDSTAALLVQLACADAVQNSTRFIRGPLQNPPSSMNSPFRIHTKVNAQHRFVLGEQLGVKLHGYLLGRPTSIHGPSYSTVSRITTEVDPTNNDPRTIGTQLRLFGSFPGHATQEPTSKRRQQTSRPPETPENEVGAAAIYTPSAVAEHQAKQTPT